MKPSWRWDSDLSYSTAHVWPSLISQILLSRRIPEKDWKAFLSPPFKNIRPPWELKDLTKAVDRIVAAYKNHEKICIYADFDLDGTSGLALLKTGFERLGFRDFITYQPLRLSEGYGLHLQVIEELALQGVRVLVTIDVGITAVEAVLRARELGIDVIITDHHLPKQSEKGEVVPEAFAVINPNQQSCSSGLGHLSGAGVAFYFLWALKERWKKDGLSRPEGIEIKDLLDCFVIATLTDMVPLIAENRVLVRQGLKALEQTTRPGLKELLKKLGLSPKKLTSQDVAIRFAPKLNAVSRLEIGLRPVDLFTVEDISQAKELVTQVVAQNSHRVDLQAQAEEIALSMLESWPHRDFVFLVSEKFHKGVVGLVATKVSQWRHCPAFVGFKNQDDVVVGSARLPRGHQGSAVEILAAGREHLIRFGGHRGAAGFEFLFSQYDSVIAKMAHFLAHEGQSCEPISLEIDAKAEFSELTEDFMDWYYLLEPFGQGFAPVQLLFEEVELIKSQWIKEDHLKLTLKQGDVEKTALWFAAPRAELLPLLAQLKKHPFARMNLIGEPQLNVFMQKTEVQILIKDIEVLEDAIVIHKAQNSKESNSNDQSLNGSPEAFL